MADDTAGAPRRSRREHERRYEEANRDRINENRRRRREANRETEKEKAHQYYLANRDKVLETNRRWAEANPERSTEGQKRWKAANREKILAQRRQRYAANHEKLRAQAREQARRRRERDPEFQKTAKRRFVHGPNWEQVVAGFKETQEDRCYLCGDPLDWDAHKAVTIDHDHRCCPKARSCDICRRGLACTLCNKLIGLAHDDVARLRRIADALEVALDAFEKRFTQAPQQEAMF